MTHHWRASALVLTAGLIMAAPLGARSPKAAKPPKVKAIPGLLVKSGESWLFKVERGQPVDARKVDSNALPTVGEIKVSIDGQAGTTMTIVNNAPNWYNYRAFLVNDPAKRGTPTSSCTLMGGGRSAFENWPQGIAAIRLTDFEPAEGEQVVCR